MRRAPPMHVLVIEDEALIAMHIAMLVEDAGHQVVGEANSLQELRSFGPETPVDLAFVDVHLARGSSGIDATAHIRRCWPDAIVVFVTANPKRLSADLDGAHGVIAKPFTTAGFASAINYLQEGILDPPPTTRCPSALIEAPRLTQAWHHW